MDKNLVLIGKNVLDFFYFFFIKKLELTPMIKRKSRVFFELKN